MFSDDQAPSSINDLLDLKNFRYEYFKATGPGGQHRNKVTSAVRCIHMPTGLKQERTSRCQHSNKKEATQAVIKLLIEQQNNKFTEQLNVKRKQMVGYGGRNEKRRTYRFQDDCVIDHISNESITCKQFMKGRIFKLWI